MLPWPHLAKIFGNVVVAGGDDPGAVRAHGTSGHKAGVAAEGGLGPLGVEGGVPDLEGLVGAGGDDPGAVGAHRTTCDARRVTGEGGPFSAAGDIPDLEGLVGAGGDDPGAVRAHGTSGHIAGVAAEGDSFSAAGDIPDLEGLVGAGGDDPGAVWAHGTSGHRSGVPGEGAGQRLGLPLSRAQVQPGGAARRAAPGRLIRHPLGGLALGGVPLPAVVELLEDEGGEAPEVGRREVVQLAGVVARERLENLALVRSCHFVMTPVARRRRAAPMLYPAPSHPLVAAVESLACHTIDAAMVRHASSAHSH